MSASTPNAFSSFHTMKHKLPLQNHMPFPTREHATLQVSCCCCPPILPCFSSHLCLLTPPTFLQFSKLLIFLRAALLHSPDLTKEAWLLLAFPPSRDCSYSLGSRSSLHLLTQQWLVSILYYISMTFFLLSHTPSGHTQERFSTLGNLCIFGLS